MTQTPPPSKQRRKAARPMPRPRRVPQRTCVACRQVAGKRTLVRLVRTPAGSVANATVKDPRAVSTVPSFNVNVAVLVDVATDANVAPPGELDSVQGTSPAV